jgi:hypothetical protein
VQKTISTAGLRALRLPFHGGISAADRREDTANSMVGDNASDRDFLLLYRVREGIHSALCMEIVATDPSPAYANSLTNFSESGFVCIRHDGSPFRCCGICL